MSLYLFNHHITTSSHLLIINHIIINHHIITSSHQLIITSSHQLIITSSHQLFITSKTFFYFFPVIKMMFYTLNNLIIFVTFTGYQYHITGLSQCTSGTNCFTPVNNSQTF